MNEQSLMRFSVIAEKSFMGGNMGEKIPDAVMFYDDDF